MTTAGFAKETATPKFGMDGFGNAVSVWEDVANRWIRYSTFDGGKNTWTPPKTISGSGQLAFLPAISVNSNGHAVVLWYVKDSTVGKRLLYAAFIPFKEKPESPVLISTTKESVLDDYSVKLDDEGLIIAVWNSVLQGSAGSAIRSATSAFLGSWEAATTLSN